MKPADQRQQAFPLFKGCTRVPMVAGVPSTPLLFMLFSVATLAMAVSLWCWLLVPPLFLVMRGIAKVDDKAFRIWGLWFDTKFRNSNKAFWGASSYSPSEHTKRRFK